MITEVLPSALAVLGDRRFRDSLQLDGRLGAVRTVVVLLVDGMGSRQVPHAARLQAALAAGEVTELQSTLPSTTPTSVVSLCTGVRPGEHGILGFRVALPGTDDVLTHIQWRDDPEPALWAPQPTVFGRSSISSTVVMPAMFASGGLTEAAYRGAAFIGLHKIDDQVEVLLSTVQARPGLILGYTSAVDTAAHVHGVASAQWQRACDEVAALIERLVSGLPDDAALIVTADHGCLDVPSTSRLEIRDDERLAAGLRVVSGEPRLRYLHTRPGAHEDVLAAWREVLGERASVLTRDEAVAQDLFGPVRAQFLDRIGDIVVLCGDRTAVHATGWEPEAVRGLVGMHGSRDPEETSIPLVTYSSRP